MSDITEQDRYNNMIGSLVMIGLSIIAASALAIALWAGLT
jgi:hypothetical protein